MTTNRIGTKLDLTAKLLTRERAARRETERALALLDLLLAASPVGLVFLDSELRYVRINDALAAINGLPAQAHIGRTVREAIPALAPSLEPLLKKVIGSGKPIVDAEFHVAPPSTPDRLRWFLASYFPVRVAEDRMLGIGGVVVEITDRKYAAEERERLLAQLDAERAWLRAVLDQLPAGVIIAEAPSGRIIFSNQRCAEILRGPPAKNAICSGHGRDWSVLNAIGEPVSGEELPLARAVRGEAVTAQELLFPQPDKTVVTVRAGAAPVRDKEGKVVAAVVAFDDITERRRAEEAQRFLAEASKKLAESMDYDTTLQEIARLAVLYIADWCFVEIIEGERCRDDPLVVAHVDPSKTELTRELRRRYPPDLTASMGVARVIRTGQSELHAEIPDELLAATAKDEEHLALRRQLGMKSAMIVALVARGRTLGAITFVSGGSGRRFTTGDLAMAEELARRAATAIDNARLYREAHEATRLREQVLAIVSHDLRNPLSAINVSAALLARTLTDEHSRKPIATIRRAADRMERLIGDLLDMASIQAGRLSVELHANDVASLVAEAVEQQEPVARENGVHLKKELAVGGSRSACDQERVLQVFSNLIGNAIKFCRAGDSVTVRASVKGNLIEFAIIDTGPGISAEELPHVFEQYWSAKRHEKKGTGLGLYISKWIVEAHGGRLWAESELGVGSAFYFTLQLLR